MVNVTKNKVNRRDLASAPTHDILRVVRVLLGEVWKRARVAKPFQIGFFQEMCIKPFLGQLDQHLRGKA